MSNCLLSEDWQVKNCHFEVCFEGFGGLIIMKMGDFDLKFSF